MMKWLILGFAAMTMVHVTAAEAQRGRVSLEIDPITTALGARNVLLYFSPSDHWTVSGIAFAADFPEWVDDLMSYKNRDKNFDSQINLSAGVGADYYFQPSREGMHVGLILFLWNFEVSRNQDTAEFSNFEVLPRIGYRVFPFENSGLYFDAFGGLQFEFEAKGDPWVDGEEVERTPALPFATVHLGFHF